jgi:plasmid stabilization system protein ParE
VKIRFTVRADQRVQIVDRWWRKHRREAPDLFKEELAAAQLQLVTSPYSGTPHLRVRGRLFRRLLLPKTRQWLYYRVIEKSEVITIYTVWGAQRGRDPKLR